MKWFPLLVTGLIFIAGCADSPPPAAKNAAAEKDDVQVQRAKLSVEDRALADAQEWCPITEEKLGSMGVPPKVMVKGRPVFLCCSGCEKKALADPDKTLAKVEELKTRKKSQPK